MTDTPKDPLDDLMKALESLAGRRAVPGDRTSFQRYLDLLSRWDRTHHMTALRSPRAIVRRLFIDSLLFLPLLPPRPLAMADIGAGAGIPGVPLRLADPGISLTLIETRRKRVSFLKSLRRDLGLDELVILEGRAEALISQIPEFTGKFDVVVSRAVGSLRELVPVSMRYLKPGGSFIASGPPAALPYPPLPIGLKAEWKELSNSPLGPRLFLTSIKEC